MTYPDAISKGFMLGVFIAISVGPTLFAILRYSMHHGLKAGVCFVCGVSLSDIIYVALANMANQYVNILETHQKEVGFVGGALFTFVGLMGLFYKGKKKGKNFRSAAESDDGLPKALTFKGYLRLFISGFLMNGLNPAVVVLWMGSLTLSSAGRLSQRIVFYAVCLGVVLSMDVLKVFLSGKIRKRLTLQKIDQLNKMASVVIMVLGVALFIKAFMMKG